MKIEQDIFISHFVENAFSLCFVRFEPIYKACLYKII